MRYFFQNEIRPDLSLPWPVLVGEDGRVLSGRPDAWCLLGFQITPQKQEIARTFEDAIRDPKWVQGKFPVYSGALEETIFVVLERIERMEIWEQDNLYQDIR